MGGNLRALTWRLKNTQISINYGILYLKTLKKEILIAILTTLVSP